MELEVNRARVDGIFKTCPNCGYEDGFHSMFETIEGADLYSWRFICPNCHKIFDIGLKVPVGD